MQNLGLLVNILAGYDKYHILNRDNLMIKIEMHLFQKQKPFPLFSASFLKSRLNFKRFEKKDDPYSFSISEIKDSKKMVTWMSKKSRLRGPFDKQYGKGGQALLNSASQHIYHIHLSLENKFSGKRFLLLTCKIMGCLLTHWLRMTSIIFLIETI